MSITLRLLAETADSVTFGWDPVPGAAGYRFSSAGKDKMPHTWDPLFRRDRNYPACNTRFSKADWYKVEALGVTAEGVFPAVTPPPPPPGLPFAEATLRTPFNTYTTADIPVGSSHIWTIPDSTKDALIDLGWVKRDRALKIATHPGQRVHVKNVYIDVSIAATSGNVYSRGGFGFRPVAANQVPSDHLSLTGCLITGTNMADGLTYGISSGYTGVQANKVTFQQCRVESASYYRGAKITNEPSGEHFDAFQMQGTLGTLEFGLCTFYACDANYGGKCWMLNDYLPAGYTVNANKVNFRDGGPGGTNNGAFIIQDIRAINVNFTDCYGLVESSSPSYQWTAGSSLFFFYGSSLKWTSSGTAPNRTASFPGGSGFTGVVLEGKSPDGNDYVTRAGLGL